MAIITGRNEDFPQRKEYRLPVHLVVHVGDDNDALTDLRSSRLEIQRLDLSGTLRWIDLNRCAGLVAVNRFTTTQCIDGSFQLTDAFHDLILDRLSLSPGLPIQASRGYLVLHDENAFVSDFKLPCNAKNVAQFMPILALSNLRAVICTEWEKRVECQKG